mmetsp:Transcript_1884/g.3297  ORF Transcript_1884/g.3297 Transcript_1884/m.3297 type:complete len:450 (-) Transcript_1884:139-1488(-)
MCIASGISTTNRLTFSLRDNAFDIVKMRLRTGPMIVAGVCLWSYGSEASSRPALHKSLQRPSFISCIASPLRTHTNLFQKMSIGFFSGYTLNGLKTKLCTYEAGLQAGVEIFASLANRRPSFADVVADFVFKVTSSASAALPNSYSAITQDSDVLANRSDRQFPRRYSSTPLTEYASKPPLQFVFGTHMIPHPDKAYRGGEDALFVSTDFNAAGVADGVGGWSNQGIDPGLFSRQLMFGAKEAVEDKGAKDPVRILSLAYKQVRVPGSSTACIIVLDGDERMLRGANLGDSGILVLRGTEVLYRTVEQQHYFNCPFQLGSESVDTPESAIRIAVSVQEGDLVIMGTDGLWDNMYDKDMIEICANEASRDNSPETIFTQVLAERLALRAHHLAKNGVWQSPFAVKARQSGYRYLGGKMDDVTVVVCSIVGADTLVPYSDGENPVSWGQGA